MTNELTAPSFEDAVEAGEITHRDGWHNPNQWPRWYTGRRCGCTTRDGNKGAYRDVTVEMPDGRTVYFYHQSPIVVEKDGKFRLDSHGYRTSTTKERINRYSPVRVYQEDFEWFVGPRDGPAVDFTDGMVVEA